MNIFPFREQRIETFLFFSFFFFFFSPLKSLRFLRFPRAKRRMYRSKTTPACIPSSCASDRFRRVTRVSFPVLGGKRLWRKRVGKEEERVTIQRCTKIVRFPERKTRARAYMCGCICVCVCVTLDRYGYRLFTAVAWPDKSTERCCSPSFLYRLHATQPGPAFNRMRIYSLFSPIPFHLRDDLPFLLYLRLFLHRPV